MKKKRMTFAEFFTLNWKKTAIALMFWIGAVFLHNFIYLIYSEFFHMEFEEPGFFVIAVIIIPVYFLISIIYTLIKRKKKK